MICTNISVHPDYDAERRTVEARYADGAVGVSLVERNIGGTVATDVRFHGTPVAVLAILDELRDAVLAALPDTDLAKVAAAELAR